MDVNKIKKEMSNINNNYNIPDDIKKLNMKILATTGLVMDSYNKLEYSITKFFESYQEVEYDENNFYLKSDDLLDIKIFLKGKLLDSEVCQKLNENSVDKFTSQELDKYIIMYEEKTNIDMDKLKIGLKVYKELENIYSMIINLKNLIYSNLIYDILRFKTVYVDSEEIGLDLKNKASNISDKVNELAYKKMISRFTYDCFIYDMNVFYNILKYN